MHHQFLAGMQVCDIHFAPLFVLDFSSLFRNYCIVLFLQTVAVIPVLPHGVIQLGSFFPVNPFLSLQVLFYDSGAM
jgi:hypothetical protein